MCDCKGKCSCSSLITTGKGPTGATGAAGPAGANGADGVVNWSSLDLDCWVENDITTLPQTNNEISQDLVDVICELKQALDRPPIAVNDYRTMSQQGTLYIQVIDNDQYYPDATVTITIPPSNGTATVEADNKTIKYIPDPSFVGTEDFGYTITDTALLTSSATITVVIDPIVTQETIETTVTTQLIQLLQSNEYWDLGFAIGEKIGISALNLNKFDFSNIITAGKGTVGDRYAKWAICNGNNGTEDLTEGTFRGYSHLNPDYDMGVSGKDGGSDTLNIVLDKGNIPAHTHLIPSAGLEHANDVNPENQPVVDQMFPNGTVSEDGTADGLKVSPDAIIKDIRNTYKTVILIQKVI